MADDQPDTAHQERAEILETTRTVNESARNIEQSTSHIESTSDRTTQLAADRTVFSAERTYAAWVRTGLASLASGIGAKALLAHVASMPLIMLASTVLVLFSVFCFCAAVWRELVPRWDNPMPRAQRIPRMVLFLINGSLAAVALVALIGIWVDQLHLP